MTDVRNVGLVHGGFVDGSGWQGVYEALTANGYRVAVVQNPTVSLEGDVAVTRRVIDGLDGPVVLAGHSYGGAVITAAGTHEKVAALVYIAAFAPDKGESVNTLIAGFPTDRPQPPILPPKDGFLFLDRDKFHAGYGARASRRCSMPTSHPCRPGWRCWSPGRPRCSTTRRSTRSNARSPSRMRPAGRSTSPGCT